MKKRQLGVIKPAKGWMIYGWFGYYFDIRPTKKEIIAWHCAMLHKSWYMLQKHGDRAVQVEIKAL